MSALRLGVRPVVLLGVCRVCVPETHGQAHSR